ncbi:MAG: uracil-DNA glycosylase [Tagaea sp.]|nr:uracil-DNA glycosylase [Tagaea sp.]
MSFAEPARDCPLCPRLVALRAALRAKHPAWANAPVPSFGALGAQLLIVGLAPGLKGANRTGRPFTGDYAGDLLYATLLKFGWAKGEYRAGREDAAWAPDSLALTGARIANAVRCLPPQNKPTPQEAATCRPFLVAEIAAMPKLRVVLALGRLAHDQVLTAFGRKVSSAKFAHGALHDLGDGRALADSYHCSRYNTNTGRLTPPMFEAVFHGIAERMT